MNVRLSDSPLTLWDLKSKPISLDPVVSSASLRPHERVQVENPKTLFTFLGLAQQISCGSFCFWSYGSPSLQTTSKGQNRSSASGPLLISPFSHLREFLKIYIYSFYLFLWLFWVLVAAHGIFSLHWSISSQCLVMSESLRLHGL